MTATDRYASEVGIRVLEQGGNAVDAAVAVAFVLAVVNPEAGNIGGGGFLLVRLPDGTTQVLDYRTTAPGAAHRDMFSYTGEGEQGRSVRGHLSAAVPGSVRGLWEAHRELGSRPWGELVDPSVSLAKGFVVEERLVSSFRRRIVEELRRFPGSSGAFLPRRGPEGPEPPAVGDILRQPDLARTLERVRDHGAQGFYGGETAMLIAAEMQRGGGIMTAADLANYTSVWRRPVRFQYRGQTMLSLPPPSAGGLTLAGTSQILAQFDLGSLEWHGPRHVHLMAETWRRVHADRSPWLGDPDFEEVPVELLVSPEHGATRAREISLNAATPSAETTPIASSDQPLKGNTTHVSIVDPMGGAVAMTTTINNWYGSKVVVEGAGFLLNGDMDDFSTSPGSPNQFGLVQGSTNAIAPGKRMVSTMTPTIVLGKSGGLRLVVGTPGGATIPTTMFQVISNVIDHRMDLAEAVGSTRVHHQHLPDRIRCEPDGLPARVVRKLEALGHDVFADPEPWGDVQAVAVNADGMLDGVSDWRKGGRALGF